jgi:hypothetical protein
MNQIANTISVSVQGLIEDLAKNEEAAAVAGASKMAELYVLWDQLKEALYCLVIV